MSDLKNRLLSNAKHWQDNFFGIFLITAILFAIVIAVSQHFPSGGTSSLLWLLGIVGLASLVGWMWLAQRTGAKTAERVLFRTR